jgi:hypothetical protein
MTAAGIGQVSNEDRSGTYSFLASGITPTGLGTTATAAPKPKLLGAIIVGAALGAVAAFLVAGMLGTHSYSTGSFVIHPGTSQVSPANP